MKTLEEVKQIYRDMAANEYASPTMQYNARDTLAWLEKLETALQQIQGVRDIGCDFKDEGTGRWVNYSAIERDSMYAIATQAIGVSDCGKIHARRTEREQRMSQNDWRDYAIRRLALGPKVVQEIDAECERRNPNVLRREV